MAARPVHIGYERQPLYLSSEPAFVTKSIVQHFRIRTSSRDSALAFHSSSNMDVLRHPEKISIRNFASSSDSNRKYRIVHSSTSKNHEDNDRSKKIPNTSNSFNPSDDTVESQTLEWIRRVVIGYNLCPFAEKPLREDKLKLSVVRGNDTESIASTVLYEMIMQTERPGTTVVIAPEFFPDDFEEYMALVQYLEEDIIEEHEDLRGVVQIAPFHPLFQFEGSGNSGVDNYTNRSPYPMFHILRENEVSKAVDKLGGDASKVWERNVRLLEHMEMKLGKEGVENAMKGERVMGMEDVLKEVKVSGFSDTSDKL
ncbi:hypothetical protein HJC23_011403 [Cyclotella cryptica]|uniref:DUF1415 domain-containing protein n=1 Tax=Cyclotella cryptica TaxID=29204 RepID=A0ABD3PQ42_9STRA